MTIIDSPKNITPAIEITISSVKNVLVIAPHSSDQIFGCGGTVALLNRRGSKITTVIVSAEEEVDAEAALAARLILDLNSPTVLGLSTENIGYGEFLINQLIKEILESDAELVFLPSPTSLRSEHQSIGFSGAEAIRRIGREHQVAFYEVFDPLPSPNLVLDISQINERKLHAMQCFQSPPIDELSASRISGLNLLRAHQLGAQVTSAEAFSLISAADLAKGLTGLLDGPVRARSKLGVVTAGGNMPLVSVIIRSMDRPTLSDAVNSINFQTYSNIEIVVVNAFGSHHQKVSPWCERFPVRMVGTGAPVHRTLAANMGLDAAQGEYLVFLDDDDWFEADHVQNLVSTVLTHKDVKVAYTGVKCVDENKNPIPNKFDFPFDPLQLIAGNFIPIHATLFSRSLLELGCRMDESLDLYEDWDFWIQLSQHSNFVKVEGLSAVYRIAPQTGFGVHADPQQATRAALVIYRKWFLRLPDHQISGLMFAVRDNRIKHEETLCLRNEAVENEAQVHRLSKRAHNLSQSLEDKAAHISSLGAQIHDLTQLALGRQSTILKLQGEMEDNHAKGHEKDARIQELNEQISIFNTKIAIDEARILHFEQEITGRDQIIQQQSNTISEIRQSSSWRVTQPLRQTGRIWRKLKVVSTVANRLLQRHAFSTVLKKTLGALRREGLGGVRVRIRQQYLSALQAGGATAPMAFSIQGDGFEPAAIVRDLQGHYALAAHSQGYTYIEPQRPDGLDTRLAVMPSAPKFSIVVPTYNTPPDLLAALLASVQRQWYPHWQLILVDDASPLLETRQALARITHPQIKLLNLEENRGIAGATNAALDVADGDFIVFLDHDDELTVDCLYELALCIEREQADYIYSDEDKITSLGGYSEPHFKPDWSPDTMMSTMFTCHVSCVRRSLIQKVGGLRSDYDGCQDWDFVLRISEHTTRISHIPKVLYHWRIIPGSTAADISAKSYILDASQRVREAALARRGLKGTVEPITQVPGYFRVSYQLQGDPLISIVIPTRDNEKVLRRCVDSIEKRTRYRNFELVILDNGSVEPVSLTYLDELRKQDGVVVIRHDAPFNFSELNNIGALATNGELLLFLNDDTEVLQDDWLERLGGFAQLSHVGAVGAKLLYPGNTQTQHAGVLNLENGPVHAFLRQDGDSPGYYMRNLLEYNWLAVTGACLMVERKKFDAVAGFCESLPVAYNDIDFCIRLRDAGLYNVVCQAVRLTHHESASRGLDHIAPEKWARLMRDLAHFYERNPRYFQHDPFHNPNLLSTGMNFEVPA